MCFKFAPYGSVGFSWIEKVWNPGDSDPTGVSVLCVGTHSSSSTGICLEEAGWFQMLQGAQEVQGWCCCGQCQMSRSSALFAALCSPGCAHITQDSTESFSRTLQCLSSPSERFILIKKRSLFHLIHLNLCLNNTYYSLYLNYIQVIVYSLKLVIFWVECKVPHPPESLIWIS